MSVAIDSNKTRSISKAMLIALIVYVIGFLVGLFIGTFPLDEYVSLEDIVTAPTADFLYIFGSNLKTCIILIIGLGIFSIVLTLQQGFVLGFLVGITHSYTQHLQFLWLLLPHGLFEIPAIILSCAVGIQFLMAMRRRQRETSFLEASKVFVLDQRRILTVILVLLLVAGIIESYFTGYVLCQ